MPSPLRHCGLDFGTSNTTLGVADARGARLVALEGDRVTIPSTLFFDFETDHTLYGRAATAAYVGGSDGRMMRSLKSVLGSSLADESVRVKRRVIPFLELIGGFVGELKRRAEAGIGEELDSVVVGRPAHYVDDDPLADREAQDQMESAVSAQGFRHIEFQFEPIAAALDYEQSVTREEIGLVIDLGGGTSDFSIVRVSPERSRANDRSGDILATAGVHIGGTDFDRLLSLRKAMPALGYQTPTADGKRPLPSGPYVDLATWHRINRLYTPETLRELRHTQREARDPDKVDRMISIVAHREGHKLAGAVEESKIALTHDDRAPLAFEGEEVTLTTPIARKELAAVLAPSIERIADTIGLTLATAGLGADRIETLILTGGSTQIPAILARLRTLFPAARFVDTDAFGSVGLGLALDARRKFG
ncbi:MAG: Hsp70 family protein [Devosia sp.]|uniref:Hsp70 family protein n=1 Tax=Devosia sp. TaxID=1871048 RepID=UPI001A5DB0CF|nr:Hsp70 family protein [Devosia sp.]MBL8597470.1 Hsp70 family protein [Devosia sp.]